MAALAEIEHTCIPMNEVTNGCDSYNVHAHGWMQLCRFVCAVHRTGNMQNLEIMEAYNFSLTG